jgi:hypothetical protein
VALSHVKFVETDPTLGTLYLESAQASRELRREAGHLDAERQKLQGLVGEFPEEAKRLDKLVREQDAADEELSSLTRKRTTLSGRLSALQKAGEEARASLAVAREREGKAREGLTDEQLAAAKAADPAEMKAEAQAKIAEAAAARAERAQVLEETKTLTTQVTELDDRHKDLKRSIQKITDKDKPVVALSDPATPREHAKKGLWVECFARPADPGGEPFLGVRVVSVENYTKDGGTLTPRAQSGESVDRIEQAGSQFAALLASKGPEGTGSHYLYCFVRPNAFEAFRAVRKFAEGSGWEVRWDPIPAGRSVLDLGGSAP